MLSINVLYTNLIAKMMTLWNTAAVVRTQCTTYAFIMNIVQGRDMLVLTAHMLSTRTTCSILYKVQITECIKLFLTCQHDLGGDIPHQVEALCCVRAVADTTRHFTRCVFMDPSTIASSHYIASNICLHPTATGELNTRQWSGIT